MLRAADIPAEEVAVWVSPGAPQFGATVGFHCPWQMAQLLVQAADEEGVPKSVVLRRALARELGLLGKLK